MEISDTRQGGFVIVTAVGELSLNSSDAFSRHCLALIEDGERELVLDLSKIKYLSSAGVRVILVVDRALRENGGTLTLCSPSDQAQLVLKLSGLLNQFKMYSSMEDLPKEG